MIEALQDLWRDEAGATAVEYGMMLALIAVIIFATVHALGDKVKNAFSDPDLTNGLGG